MRTSDSEKVYKGKPCLVVATGPSLNQHDLDRMRANDPTRPTIVVNDAWKLAPWATTLYAGDASWWNEHEGVPAFKGEKLIASGPGSRQIAADKWGLDVLEVKYGRGLSFNPMFVYSGWNSGFAAFNLAVIRGASPIYLLGFDHEIVDRDNIHFFGNHEHPLRNGLPVQRMLKEMNSAAKQINETRIQVINLSRKTAIRDFARMTVDELLDHTEGD